MAADRSIKKSTVHIFYIVFCSASIL